jgi:hypothetical protein
LNKVEPKEFERSKRQTTSVNCTALQIQIAQTTNNISTTQILIQNTTITLNSIKLQVIKFELRVATSNGTALKSAQNLLGIYLKLQNSTTDTLNGLNKQLIDSQIKLAQFQNDYNTFCVGTTTTVAPASPCGKIKLKISKSL